ncbi:MAG: homoserine dehydrogenase [Candidatus Pelagibacter bacterium]|nr:homoserine dehydrogenase [Candidatus Pelagibacter bacterium]
MRNINICIAGLGTVGSNVILSLNENNDYINSKANLSFNILGVSAKNKFKKRICDIKNFTWCENPLDLLNIKDCNVLIELIGEEKGLSFDLVKQALEKKIHVVTANKALLAMNGSELFKIAEHNNVLLLYEAAVAGGIPIIKSIKNSIYLDKINKISGILNGTTNFILTEMEKFNLDFQEVLKRAQSNGYAEADPTNDIEGIDSAHKLTLLSTLCFGSEINFKNNKFSGIGNIHIEDIHNAKKLGCRIKLISESQIIEGKIINVTEPRLIKIENPLSNVDGVINAINVETEHLQSLFYEGEGAGGKATASSIISDLFEISNNSKSLSLGYKISELISFQSFDLMEKISPYYLRIISKDLTGVLSKITFFLNESGISIETILQIPENQNNNNSIPIIIVTHDTKKSSLMIALEKIEKQEFILEKIVLINMDKNY